MDDYITALHRDPNAPPPDGMDPALARAIRAAVLAGRVPPPDAAIRARIREKVTQATPTFSSNGHQEEDLSMTTHVLPRPRSISLNRVTLAAAVIAVTLFVALLYPSLLGQPNSPTAVYISQKATNQATFERYINEAWNAGDSAMLNDVLTEDHVLHQTGEPDISGIDGMAAVITTYRTIFPDWHFTIEALTATDDEVWARLTATGTHRGPLVLSDGTTIPSDGSVITVDAMINARFVEGKIAEQWLQANTPGLLEAAPSLHQVLTESQNMATVQRLFDSYYPGGDRSLMEEAYQGMFYWHYAHRHGPQYWITNDPSEELGSDVILDGFKFLTVSIDDLAASGDVVMARTTFSGQFFKSIPAPWSGEALEPTGEQVTWTWVFVWRFEEGRIAEEWWVWDWPLPTGE